MQRPRFGLTILELVVATAAITALAGLVLVAAGKKRGCAYIFKDATQIEQIHQAMLIYARDNDRIFPTPGLINRLPDADTGKNISGRGDEDFTLNHTAPLYSAMIAQNYFTPELVVGPTEPSPHVVVKDDYDYIVYDPLRDSFWDRTFSADLTQAAHVSYAHLAICGERKEKLWRDQMSSTVPMFSTRGPRNGATAGAEYNRSVTLDIHGESDEWVGNVIFADNHVETLNTFEPPELQTPGIAQSYNLFRMDGGALGISIASSDDDVTRVWDTLQ